MHEIESKKLIGTPIFATIIIGFRVERRATLLFSTFVYPRGGRDTTDIDTECAQ